MLYKEFLRRFQPTPRRDVVTINMADIPGMSLGDFGGLLNAIFQAGRSLVILESCGLFPNRLPIGGDHMRQLGRGYAKDPF